MDLFLNILQSISDFLWGTPMTVALVGTGVYLSFKFKFRYIINMKFHFKNTFAKAFKKNDGEGSVTGFAAACTAMANTIGIGNIGGVATAITMGGPGAVFWMWISALFGMSTKAAEIILGQRYRVKFNESSDEYICDRSFVMKNAMGWKKSGFLLAISCFLFGPWTCLVQTNSVTSSLNEAFGINPTLILAVLGITVIITIVGGLKRISATVEKVVPFMAMIYILAGLGILILNIDKVPESIGLIFKSAFTPVAGVGGFAGATVRESIRYGIARGLYSNDAGTGYGIVAHAAAKTDHPVRQSSWGWGEVFLDTIVVCSVTALSIIITNVYVDFPDITSAQLTTVAFKVAYGDLGGYFMGIATTLFAWTTIVGMYYASEKSVNYFLGDSKKGKIGIYIYMIYFIIPVIFFSNFEAELLWAVTDLLSAIYVIVTLILIYGNRKEIFRLYNEFWDEKVKLKDLKEA
ncbi:alanine/glycine:cation symporter family protein [Terrisporobacter vanillatitrophus]|uniref:alanine/glycine:cation symporter family protein n=1 Tax=Terrisporobacter vanillatitrophus TaxID=3058402 RepID=UPI00336787B5